MTAPAPAHQDGHRPVWALLPGTQVTVIGCECGAVPKKRAARTSMQHVWHQAHRRGLRLQPVEYQWPEADYNRTGAVSTGGYVKVRGHVWRDGGWVKGDHAMNDVEESGS